MRWLWPGWGRGSEQEGLLAATFLVVWPERGEGARVEAYAVETAGTAFGRSRDRFETVVSWLGGQESAGCTHAELEARLQVEGRELLRQLLQDHLDLRAQRETRLTGVVGADGVARGSAEAGRRRDLATVFGEAATSVERVTGQGLGNRQVEQLAQRAAVDFDRFYASRPRQLCVAGDVLVLSCDGKGIVMRPEALRKATKRAAGKATTKLVTRLSKGEKRNRKRMAEVGAVYDATPAPRTPDDILPAGDEQGRAVRPAPTARGKWLLASVAHDAAEVITAVFDEASRRDPGHRRTWVALVDGNTHQIDRVHAEARARGVQVTIVVDFVHVLENLWRAAWCFFAEGNPDAETWVRAHALRILQGRASDVAGAIRRKATCAGLAPGERRNADTAATYLTNKRPYLDYPTALEAGWPIATGVIEGACRHLVQDRMDLTGARWGLDGAETILKLRALRSNGDFETYWAYHLAQERQRVHQARYANGLIPATR